MADTQTVQFWDYSFLLRKRKHMIIATVLVALSIVTLVNNLQKAVYWAYTDLLVESGSHTSAVAGVSVYAEPINPTQDYIFFDTQQQLLYSSYFKNLVVEELANNRSELPENLRDVKKEGLVGLLSYEIKVPSPSRSQIMRISIENGDPRLAAFLANTIAKVYIRYTQESHFEANKKAFSFLIEKIEEIRDKLAKSNVVISDLDIEGQLAAALKVYGEKHPLVIELKAKKRVIEQAHLAKSKDEKNDSANELALKDPEASIEQVEHQDGFAVKRSIQINEELYQGLLKKLQELSISNSVPGFTFRVIESAKIPSTPKRPNKRMNLIIGFIMGSVIGVGLAFFREYIDTNIKTVEELKNIFNLTVLGLIPTIGEYKPKPAFILFWERLLKKDKNSVTINKDEITDELKFQIHRLVSTEQLQAPIAEAYRTLRTNLQFTQLDKPLKTLLITSSIRGEGKTTTTVNLGIILAQTGKKILIVDTDLRRPRIHKAFSTGRDVGLTNLLMGESRFEDVVIPVDVQNLSILPSGPLPPNPAELVASERMKALISYMSSQYDLVLFDSPPLVAVTDAALLATEVDGLLLVVEAGALPRELLKQGLDRLNNVKANILGTILNNVNIQKGSYYFYYYHYYHYDYAYADKV